jgi:hypothetical protein
MTEDSAQQYDIQVGSLLGQAEQRLGRSRLRQPGATPPLAATSCTCTTTGLLLRASTDPQWLFVAATPVRSFQGCRAWLIPQPEKYEIDITVEG